MSDNPLITTSELAALLGDPSPTPRPLVVLDVRWTLAGSDNAGFLQAHIPGATFVDLDADLAGAPGAGGRHPLPDPADLQDAWRAAGIDDGTPVVVYDGGIGMAAARAWWLLRWSGIDDVRVLDGGLPAWVAAGQDTADGPAGPPATGAVTVTAGRLPTVDIDEAAELAAATGGALLDARAAARYRGEVEPIDPVAGHIPGAVSLPISDVLRPDGTFRSPAEIRAAFAAVGISPGAVAAASCGSGVTACQLILAAEVAGLSLSLYPGSYSQWCAAGRPVATGAA